MKNKKGSFGSIFIYVIASVTALFLIIFGISAVSSINKKACESESVGFYESLKSVVSEKSENLGSRSESKFMIPCGASRIFIVDLDGNIPQKLANKTKLIRDSLDDEEGKNVFIFKGKTLMNSLSVEGISLTHPYYRCFSNRDGWIKAVVTGRSGKALFEHISERKNTSFDCTNYSFPVEYAIPNDDDSCENIIKGIGYNIYRFFPTVDKAIQKCKESRHKIEVDREFIESFNRTRVLIKIRNKENIEIPEMVYFEHILKQCISSLKRSGVKFYSDSGSGCNPPGCNLIKDDPLIVWHFTSIPKNSYFEFSYEVEGSFKDRCLQLIKGLGIVSDIPGEAPNIISSAKTSARPGVQYVYDVEAEDPDNDNLEFFLDSAPEGMSIDKITGVIRWIPRVGDGNMKHKVLVYAKNPSGLRGYQEFEIFVEPLVSPVSNDIPKKADSAKSSMKACVYTWTEKEKVVDQGDCDSGPVSGGKIISVSRSGCVLRRPFKKNVCLIGYFRITCRKTVWSSCSPNPKCPSGSTPYGQRSC